MNWFDVNISFEVTQLTGWRQNLWCAA